jgi:hypothetical protein
VTQFRVDVATLGTEELSLDSEDQPFGIVVSQDCDLEWDFRERQKAVPALHKLLPSILFCEVSVADELRGRNGLDSGLWKRVRENKDERYHFLRAVMPEQDSLAEGLPSLAIDFKRYFTVPTDELYAQLANGETRRRTRLLSPYLEHCCSRFAYFQQRVALPEDHFVKPPDQNAPGPPTRVEG